MNHLQALRSLLLSAATLQLIACGESAEPSAGGAAAVPNAAEPPVTEQVNTSAAMPQAPPAPLAPPPVQGEGSPEPAVAPPPVVTPEPAIAPIPVATMPEVPAVDTPAPVTPVMEMVPAPSTQEMPPAAEMMPAIPEPEPPMPIEPADLCAAGDCNGAVLGMDGYAYNVPCEAGGSGCSETPCVGGHFEETAEFQVTGTEDETYRVTFYARGVVEAQNYAGGSRRIGDTRMDADSAGMDLWHEGGEAPIDSYATYALHTEPAVDGAPDVYYLNSRDGTNAHDSSTWAIAYEASVDVVGGSVIRFRTYDNNCRSTLACGRAGTACQSDKLDLSAVVPAAQSTAQPFMDNGKTPQWLHLDVTAVEKL